MVGAGAAGETARSKPFNFDPTNREEMKLLGRFDEFVASG